MWFDSSFATSPQTNDLPVDIETSPSPEFPLTLPFSGTFRGFFRALLLLKPLSRSRSVAGVHVCVRVCVSVSVYIVRCCACGKTLKTRGNREMRVVWCVCVCVLCGVVR